MGDGYGDGDVKADDDGEGDRLSVILELADDAVYDVSLDGQVTGWNAGAEHLFGYGRAEAVGRPVTFLIPEPLRGEEAGILDSVRRGEPIRHYETVRVGKDGRPVDVSISVAPPRDRSGRVVGAAKIARDITRRKRAEAALRESEARFRLIYQHAPIGIGQVATDTGQLLEVNDKLCDTLACTRDELLSKTFAQLTHPDDLPGELEQLARLLAGEVPSYSVEKRYMRRDGTPVWVRVTSAKGDAEGGRRPYRVSIVEDIDEQRRMRTTLAASEERFRMTYQYAPVGIAQIALDTGEVLAANDKLCDIVGVPAAELVGRQLSDRVDPDDWRAEQELLRRLVAGDVPSYQIEKRYLHAGGPPSWVRVTATIVSPPGVRPYRLSVLEDITAKRAAEAALREREERMRAVVEGAADGIITIDDRGIIESVNPAAERLFGYDRGEMLGRNVSTLMPEPHRGRHDEYLRAYLRTGLGSIIGVGRDVTALRKDRTLFPMNLAVNVVRLSTRTLFTAVIHDLTARRKLEQLVTEASAREQQRIGQDLHDGLGQQIAGLSFFCKSLATRLAAKGLPEAADAERVSELISQALVQTRGLARGLNPVMGNQNGLMSALEELAAYVERTFAIPCRFICPSPILFDDTAFATHVYRIAQEAVTNALKHANPYQVTIRLERQGTLNVLTVEDDGSGLSDAPGRPAGIGREIMRSRAGFIGGSLEVGPGPAGGTSVRCLFPDPPLTEQPSHGHPNAS